MRVRDDTYATNRNAARKKLTAVSICCVSLNKFFGMKTVGTENIRKVDIMVLLISSTSAGFTFNDIYNMYK